MNIKIIIQLKKIIEWRMFFFENVHGRRELSISKLFVVYNEINKILKYKKKRRAYNNIIK
jgi:hypothetical protein